MSSFRKSLSSCGSRPICFICSVVIRFGLFRLNELFFCRNDDRLNVFSLSTSKPKFVSGSCSYCNSSNTENILSFCSRKKLKSNTKTSDYFNDDCKSVLLLFLFYSIKRLSSSSMYVVLENTLIFFFAGSL